MTTTVEASRSGVSTAELAWAGLAVLALIGTWGNNLAYAPLGFAANRAFVVDTLANPASRSITVDLFALCVPAFFFMFAEARRLKMRGVWWYFAGSLLIAISVAVPVFLIHRSRARRRFDAEPAPQPLALGERIALALFAVLTVVYVAASLGAFR